MILTVLILLNDVGRASQRRGVGHRLASHLQACVPDQELISTFRDVPVVHVSGTGVFDNTPVVKDADLLHDTAE